MIEAPSVAEYQYTSLAMEESWALNGIIAKSQHPGLLVGRVRRPAIKEGTVPKQQIRTPAAAALANLIRARPLAIR